MKNKKRQKLTEKVKKYGIAGGQRAASAITGLQIRVIKYLKQIGVQKPFRTNGSINCDLLMAAANEHRELVRAINELPDIEIEEAFEKRADRQRKQIGVLKSSGLLVTKEQPKQAMAKCVANFVGRLYALESRLHLQYKIPREEIRKELDAVVAPLAGTEHQSLLAEAEKADSAQ